MKIGIKPQFRIIFISIIVSIGLIVAGILIGNPGIFGNLIIIAIVVVIVPVFLYTYAKYAWIKSVENQFPNFVRDLADSARSGMSFKEAVRLASKASYGKLTPEIQTMKNKLSMGISFLRVIDLFIERVKASKLIREAMTIIKESYLSGGNIANTLDSVARDIVMIKETQAERASMTRQHVLIMYGIYFMFLGIAIMIVFVMIPMIKASPDIPAGTFGFSFQNPCENVGFFPCNIFSAVGFILGVPEGIALYYIALFFMTVLIQGLFTGLIAGQLGDNSIAAGTKHSLVMVFSGVGTFIFLAKTGLLPI